MRISDWSSDVCSSDLSAAAIPTDRNAMDRRWAAGAPAVRLANMGAQPGGSITTRKVTRAEMNSSAMAAALDAFRQGEALPQMRGDQRVAQQHRDGHRPHPARPRGDRADVAHRVREIDTIGRASCRERMCQYV